MLKITLRAVGRSLYGLLVAPVLALLLGVTSAVRAHRGLLLLTRGLALQESELVLASQSFFKSPVAGTEGGSGEMSGRRVPLGCARVARGKTPAWLGWTQASATWGRAPPGLRVGGQLRAAIRGRGAR